MRFLIHRVPPVVQRRVARYKFILVHEGVGMNEAFADDQMTRGARGSRSTQPTGKAGVARDR